MEKSRKACGMEVAKTERLKTAECVDEFSIHYRSAFVRTHHRSAFVRTSCN